MFLGGGGVQNKSTNVVYWYVDWTAVCRVNLVSCWKLGTQKTLPMTWVLDRSKCNTSITELNANAQETNQIDWNNTLKYFYDVIQLYFMTRQQCPQHERKLYVIAHPFPQNQSDNGHYQTKLLTSFWDRYQFHSHFQSIPLHSLTTYFHLVRRNANSHNTDCQ